MESIDPLYLVLGHVYTADSNIFTGNRHSGSLRKICTYMWWEEIGILTDKSKVLSHTRVLITPCEKSREESIEF